MGLRDWPVYRQLRRPDRASRAAEPGGRLGDPHRERDVVAGRPGDKTDELSTEDNAIEVFLFPAATHTEKDGSFTNSRAGRDQRMGRDGKPLSTYMRLKADGSTSCGCWIHRGVHADGVNQAARRKPASEQNRIAAECA